MTRMRPFRYFTKTRRLAGILAIASSLIAIDFALADSSFTPLTLSSKHELATLPQNHLTIKLVFTSQQTQLLPAQKKGINDLLKQAQVTQLQLQNQQQNRRLVATVAVWPDQSLEQQLPITEQVQTTEARLQAIKEYISSQNFNIKFDGEYNMASQTSDLWSMDRNTGGPSEAIISIRLD